MNPKPIMRYVNQEAAGSSPIIAMADFNVPYSFDQPSPLLSGHPCKSLVESPASFGQSSLKAPRLTSPYPSPSESRHCSASLGKESAKPNGWAFQVSVGSDQPSPSVSRQPNLSINEVPLTSGQASP